MRRILFTFPTAWDDRQLAATRASWRAEYEPVLAPPRDSDDYGWNLDLAAHLEEVARREDGRLAGVASSSDYPGVAAAAFVAERLGLPGTPLRATLLAQHKYVARRRQREAVPEATPRFELVDALGRAPLPATLEFPCFVKPVKGSFSVLARRVDSRAELVAFLAEESTREYSRYHGRMYDRLLESHTDCRIDSAHFVAEEVLAGRLVTVEGYADRDEVVVLGVVDSILHPRTQSFVRFEYPSRLPRAVQARMEEIARRTAVALEIHHGLFNVELFHDESTGRIGIVELNPRIAGQFGDLHEKVDGISTYHLLLALAAGDRPRWRARAGRYACAASVPLRVYERVRVANAPDAAEVAAAEALHEGTLVWPEVKTGAVLDPAALGEDGASVRYAVLNVGGADPDEAIERAANVEAALRFRFEEFRD